MALDVLLPAHMNCELLATCSALGYLDGTRYEKEPDCLETIKDLIRFLRREDEKCSIRRQLGHAQILQNDLIPLVKQYHKDEELFETTIRLLVNLTQPAELCFQNVPDDKTFRNYFLEVLSHLQAYKQAFACEDFMSVMARKLKKMLDLEWESRREDHTLLMERILLLVRNILHIPADPNEEKRTDDDASVHDQVLWALNVSGLDKLLLYVASAEGEQQWCMHAIEITSHMLREQSPEVLARAGSAQQASERLKEERELEKLRQRELAEKKARILKASSRHSRFGGSFYMTDFKSISERDLIYHRPLHQARSISFERDKGATKRPKNRLPVRDGAVSRRSTLSIRLFLREFCVLFLDNCYNPLMYAVKDHILHRRAQENDESYYLWAMHFFMQFSRLYKFRVDVISETFSVQAFHYVNTQILKYLDMMTTEKKEATAWAKRMHLGLKAYRELLATLNEMTGPGSSPELRESGDVIQSNVFYVIEYREIFITLLKKYDESKSTRSFLKDVVESTHIFMKMLEKYSKSKKTLMVQKKTKKKAKRRKRRGQQREQPDGERQEEQEQQLAEVWDGALASELSAMLQGREDLPDDVVPFDAASELPVEEQRAEAMVRIQQNLRAGRAGEGLALFRAAREVWPDGDVFGAADIEPEDEFMALREIHFTNLNVPQPAEQPEPDPMEDQEDVEEDEEDEMVAEERMERGEEEFNFKIFVNKFSHPDALKSYIKLLSSYRSNTEFTNHCVVKLLHRVALECDKTPLLYQASLFRIFHKILQDPLAATDQFKEMARFGKHIVGRFFKELQTNPKLVVELLFWKDARGVYEMQEGYGTEMPSKKSQSKEWSEEEKAELAGLYEQYQAVDGGDKDVVDLIMEHLIDDTKTRRQIITQLVKQELVDSARDLKKTRGAKRVTLWREEHELELRTLFDQHRDSHDIVGAILEHMGEKRSRNKVIEKLLEMGLAGDRRELYKKRQRKRDADGNPVPRRRRRRRGAEDGVEEELEFADGLQEFPDSEPEYMDSTDAESDRENDDDDDDEEEDGEDDAASDDQEKSIEDLVAKLQRKGLTDQILWIQESLGETADDREESGDSQPTPIVPLLEANHAALRNRTFKALLKRVGLSEPRSHEEVYWRMPSELTPAALRDIAQSIAPRDGAEAPQRSLEEGRERSKKSSARYEMLKRLALSRREEKRSKGRSARDERSEARGLASPGVTEATPTQGTDNLYDAETDVSGEEEEDVEEGEEERGDRDDQLLKASARGQSSRVKRSLPSDSSSDDSDDETLGSLRLKSRESKSHDSKPSKRSRLVLSDDSDEESDVSPKRDAGTASDKEEPGTGMASDKEDPDASGDEMSIGKKKSRVNSRRPTLIESDESDEEDDGNGDDDGASEVFEVVSKKPKRPLKKQSPIDFRDENDNDEDDDGGEDGDAIESTAGERDGENGSVAEEGTAQDRSFHLVLSDDSPSDVDMDSKGAGTTEDDDEEVEDKEKKEKEEEAALETPGELAVNEDNAINFREDSTSNVADDNVNSYLDNKPEEDDAVATTEFDQDGDWEEVFDDDSDIEMTPSGDRTAVEAADPAATTASSDEDSEDDIPLRRVASKRTISSDSEDE